MDSADDSKVLYVLTGCTAVGKTEAALSWAEHWGAEILSCDSLLFYRGMDVGTAKPSRSELLRVPHHMIDVCGVREQMDIARYVELSRACAQEIHQRGRRVLVTGGSGFYLKAFFSPVVDDVEVSASLRESLSGLSPEQALERLRELNPAGLGRLDTANPRRVIRALERCLASGSTLLELADAFASKPSPFANWKLRLLRLDRPQEELETRVRTRVEEMLRAGLVDEVRNLLTQGFLDNPSAARAIGYRETIAMLEGRLALEELAGEIAKNTRALVKKQRTWFRTQLPTHPVIHPSEFVAERDFPLSSPVTQTDVG